jgi:hypothetical protein
VFIKSLTRFDRFLLNTWVGKGLECDNNAVSHLIHIHDRLFDAQFNPGAFELPGTCIVHRLAQSLS